jgi:outer membrane protein OmpA-like peptidoglycan-associated protein
MAEDWAINVKKYVPDANDAVIAAIVRYCGIALRSRDASLVSFTDSVETDRVRENYLKKKLGLVDPDNVLDAAIAAVGQRMSDDPTRNRVTVYYLLAEHFGKLGLFGGDAAEEVPVAVAPAAMPMGIMASSNDDDSRRGAAATGWGDYLPLAVLVLGMLGLLWYLTRPAPAPVPAPVVPVVAAPEAIPQGAGITESVVDGRPMVSVYFDTAKFDIYPNFDARTEAVRTYLAAHPDTHLQISGFNDPRGDAAFNAELSKNRAFAVRDGLAKLGVPVAMMDLVKPADNTDTTDSYAVARRVDITIADGPVAAAEVASESAEVAASPVGQ